ncbi:MAG: ABC transporter substrate-binding protein [Corynebacterium sp.]|nr:ABC transporter substrate-binding protein [Corynebacterium sp.]
MRPHLRHRAAAALACIGLLTSCSAGYTGANPGDAADATAITLGMTTAPASLDFTTNSGAAIGQALLGNVYEGLVRIDQQGNVQPCLAQHWDIDPTGTQYTFYLEQQVRFADGSSFDAHSAKFSLERAQSAAWTNPQQTKLDIIEDIAVIDPYTLRIVLSKPSNSFLWNLGGVVGAMFSPHGVDALATAPVGTGPYEVSHWAVGRSLSLTARKDYWGEPATNSKVELRYISDATALTNALRSGQLDAIIGLQAPELLDEILQDDSHGVSVGTTNGEVLLSMNNQRAPFDDLRVRQAVMYGVNRQAIRDTTWEGYGVDTAGAPVAPTDPWFEQATAKEYYDFDLPRAQALLADADAVGTPITISVPSLPYAQAASEILYAQLTDIGFKVHLETVEFPAVWLQQVHRSHDYDMSLVAHVEARDIPTMFGSPDYYLGFDDATTQELLSAADTATGETPQESAEKYNAEMSQAVTAIMDQAAALTLYNMPNIVVARPGLVGLPTNIVADGLPVSSIHWEDEQ